jgi:UDP-N-acetylglucosamine transferase subunit ALG13
VIFVTTGTQLAFPRLLGAIDAIAPGLGEPVIAQVGADPEARQHIETHDYLHPARFEELFNTARVIVAHAGVGTILMAKRLRKPLILVPRRYDMGEHRNDHQQATAREVASTPGVRVAWDLDLLSEMIRVLDPIPAEPGLSQQAESLIARVRRFIG